MTNTDDFFADLLKEEDKPQRTRKLGVRKTQYPKLPAGSPVTLVERSQPCMSLRCGSPSYYKMKGIAYCSTHLIIALVHELLAKSTGVENESVGTVSTSDGSSNSDSERTSDRGSTTGNSGGTAARIVNEPDGRKLIL